MQKGELDKAIADYSEAIRAAPNLSDVYAHRRDAFLRHGKWDKAIADYSKEIEISCDSSLYWGRGHAYLKKGDQDSALADFRRGYKHDPRNAYDDYYGAYCDDAFVFDKNREKKINAVIIDYSALIALDKDLAPAYWRRGQASLAHEDLDNAIADFTKFLQLNPKADRTYLHRAVAYLKKREYDKSIADCIAYIRLHPDDHLAYNIDLAHQICGDAYLEQNKVDEAIVANTKAIQIKQQHWSHNANKDAYWSRGEAYLKAGDQKKAVADFKKALGLDGEEYTVVYYDDGWSKVAPFV